MRLIYSVAALGIVTLLTGCNASSTYGIQESRWSQLSTDQRNQIAANYERIQKELREEQANMQPKKNAEELRVVIYGGRVLMPPFKKYAHFKRAVVDIKEGMCKAIPLHDKNSDNEVALGLCYQDKELKIDPSHFVYEKRHGSVGLRYSPIWKRGFTYTHVKTTGYARLDNAHIYVVKMT